MKQYMKYKNREIQFDKKILMHKINQFEFNQSEFIKKIKLFENSSDKYEDDDYTKVDRYFLIMENQFSFNHV